MKRTLQAALLVAVCAACADNRGQLAAGSICAIPPATQGRDAKRFELPDAIGTIRLPSSTTSLPLGKNPHGRRFVLKDSTELQPWVTPEPIGGLATVGPATVLGPRDCETMVDGRNATVTTMELTGDGTRTMFIAEMNVQLEDTVFLNMAFIAASAASRDTALAVLSTIRLPWWRRWLRRVGA